MASQNPFGPQPDFDLIADELRKTQNLPAVTNGDRILAQIQALHQEFTVFRQESAEFRQEAAEFRQETGREFAAIRQELTEFRQETGREFTAVRRDIAGDRRDIIGLREDVGGTREDITGIREHVTGLREDVGGIREDITGLREDVGGINLAIRASNHNNTARVQNTYLATSSDPLSPFVNASTADPIPNFPRSPQELGQLTTNRINLILRQLDLAPGPGVDLATKKQMLRVHIGLTEVAGRSPP
ncbi:hypothetical protein AYO21_04721 [Fonsecaea monophora]|uniref:Uncharacterized protein n=1 Tax=Fonsecaea monophora TaxID=254056 RepID=A0A177FAD9_9EURO|nr:hypothetical protein AYO21_04721 [Fonsecaea monophora]KAH0839127.1 hypothetical protein FOPE_05575 [Fonsecaea pedrosoi]OAG41108.1 hypothetical protein AYO21_04721 [Fonsecaea monophora]